MPIPNTGQLRLYADIAVEIGDSQGNNSLGTYADTAGFTEPDAMSDFYGYSSATVPVVGNANVPGGSYNASRNSLNFPLIGVPVNDYGGAETCAGVYWGTSSNYTSNPKYTFSNTVNANGLTYGTFNYQGTSTRYYAKAWACNSAGQGVSPGHPSVVTPARLGTARFRVKGLAAQQPTSGVFNTSQNATVYYNDGLGWRASGGFNYYDSRTHCNTDHYSPFARYFQVGSKNHPICIVASTYGRQNNPGCDFVNHNIAQSCWNMGYANGQIYLHPSTTVWAARSCSPEVPCNANGNFAGNLTMRSELGPTKRGSCVCWITYSYQQAPAINQGVTVSPHIWYQ